MQAQSRDLKNGFMGCIPIPVWMDSATDCIDVLGSQFLVCRLFISDLILIRCGWVEANYEEIQSYG